MIPLVSASTMKLSDIACSDARAGARVAGLLWQTAQFCSKTVSGAPCLASLTWGKAGSDATSKHVETKTNMHRIRARLSSCAASALKDLASSPGQ
jgi:hypothetical protein